MEIELDRVRDASQLLGQAEARLHGSSLPGSLEELLHEVRGRLRAAAGGDGTLRSYAEPDVIALRPGDHAERDWLQLGADDLIRPSGRRELPDALLRAGRPHRAVVLVPDVAPGNGLDVRSRRAAYLWLDVSDALVAVLALEWARPGGFSASEIRTLDALRGLLGELAAAEGRLRRLRDDARAGERERLAAQLHDRFGQDLAYLAVELSRAQQRHPDDGELAQLTAALRDTVAGVRTTIGELRRGEPVRVPPPARRIAMELEPGTPCRVVDPGEADPNDRAREDVAVDGVVAILRAADALSVPVSIRGSSDDGRAALEVRSDAVIDARHPGVASAIAGGARAGVTIDVRGDPTVGTWVIVRFAAIPAPVEADGEA